jgi:hypothetical protein
MARQIVILCDFHLAEHDEHVPGTERTVAFEGQPPLTAAFCDDCLKRMYDPLAAFMREHAQPATHVAAPSGTGRPGRRRRKDGTFICPFGDGRAFGKRHGVATHLRVAHEISIVDYEAEHGDLEPTDDQSGLPFQCDICELRFGSPQGRGAHQRTVHGVAGTSHVSQANSSA